MNRLQLALSSACLLGALMQPLSAQAEDPYAYMRVDVDRQGLALWAGGNHPLGGGAYLAADLIGFVGDAAGQVDVGAVLPVGALSLFPTIGFGMDFGDQEAGYLVPRLITVLEVGPLYLESWVQAEFASIFHDGRQNDFYTRDFLLFGISEVVAIGPQVEVAHALADRPAGDLISLPLGARVNLAYGDGVAVGLFLGYDLADAAPNDRLAGRFTAVINF